MHTANTVIDYRKMCFGAGCDDYIEKPITHKDFFVMLSRHLPRRRAAG